MTSALSATKSTSATTTSPNPAPRVSSALARIARIHSTIDPSLPVADPRIQEHVQNIGEEVGQQHGQGQDEYHALQHGEIPEEDRVSGQAAEAGEREDGFHDDRAAEQPPRLQADDGDDGNQRVLQ